MITKLTQEYLKERLTYNPDTGEFWWLPHHALRFRPYLLMQEAGTVTRHGYLGQHSYYRIIRIDGRKYGAHRLAFFWMTGELPDDSVDHIDGNSLNNKWCNLRQCNTAENGQNRKINRNNSSGYPGVSWSRGKWIAAITLNKFTYRLGRYESPEEAFIAYYTAKRYLHTFNPTQRTI